jgi:predicted HTH domain antitoxin
MDTLTIQIPEAILLQTGTSREDLERESRFWLALRFFERGQLTSGQAAGMCQMNRVDFLLAAGQEGVPVADLDGDELKRELGAALGR